MTLSKGCGADRALEVRRCRKSEPFLAVTRGKINNDCHAIPKKEKNARSPWQGAERSQEAKQSPPATVATSKSSEFTNIGWENGSAQIYQKSVKILVVSRKRTFNYYRIEFPQRNASNALGHHDPFVEDSCPVCE